MQSDATKHIEQVVPRKTNPNKERKPPIVFRKISQPITRKKARSDKSRSWRIGYVSRGYVFREKHTNHGIVTCITIY